MLKNEVIKSLTEGLRKKGVTLTKDEATVLHDAVFENLGIILAKGEEVSIINFGTFHSNYTTHNDIAKHVKGSKMERIQVFVLKFRVSAFLKEKLNGKKIG